MINFDYSDSSEVGVVGSGLDTADTFAALVHFSKNLEVSLFTPVSSPRVLKEPVVFSLLVSVSNKQDSMISSGSTAG